MIRSLFTSEKKNRENARKDKASDSKSNFKKVVLPTGKEKKRKGEALSAIVTGRKEEWNVRCAFLKGKRGEAF